MDPAPQMNGASAEQNNLSLDGDSGDSERAGVLGSRPIPKRRPTFSTFESVEGSMDLEGEIFGGSARQKFIVPEALVESPASTPE